MVDADLIVRGRGYVRTMPDRAVVRATVEGEGAHRDAAYGAAAGLASAVDAVVDQHRAAIDRAATAVLVVHPTTRWRKGETVRTGWRASRTSLLEVTALAELGSLLAELAAAGAAVHGPSWQLDPTNPAHGEARRLAAADARRRADDYAAALGLAVGGVLWVAEPGLRDTAPPQHEGRTVALAARMGSDPDEIVEVTPEEQRVTAAVDVGFALEAGPAPH